VATTKRARRHARETVLTARQELELLLGPQSVDSRAFSSEDARRQAWVTHRDELTAVVEFCWARIQYDLGGFLPSEGNRIAKARERLSEPKAEYRR
jgi:hypothetical protein